MRGGAGGPLGRGRGQGRGQGAVIDHVVGGGRGVEREGALGLADVVPPHGLHAHLGDQLAAVVDAQGLTLRVLARARTRGARRDAAAGAQRNVDTINLKYFSLIFRLIKIKISKQI